MTTDEQAATSGNEVAEVVHLRISEHDGMTRRELSSAIPRAQRAGLTAALELLTSQGRVERRGTRYSTRRTLLPGVTADETTPPMSVTPYGVRAREVYARAMRDHGVAVTADAAWRALVRVGPLSTCGVRRRLTPARRRYLDAALELLETERLVRIGHDGIWHAAPTDSVEPS